MGLCLFAAAISSAAQLRAIGEPATALRADAYELRAPERAGRVEIRPYARDDAAGAEYRFFEGGECVQSFPAPFYLRGALAWSGERVCGIAIRREPGGRRRSSLVVLAAPGSEREIAELTGRLDGPRAIGLDPPEWSLRSFRFEGAGISVFSCWKPGTTAAAGTLPSWLLIDEASARLQREVDLRELLARARTSGQFERVRAFRGAPLVCVQVGKALDGSGERRVLVFDSALELRFNAFGTLEPDRWLGCRRLRSGSCEIPSEESIDFLDELGRPLRLVPRRREAASASSWEIEIQARVAAAGESGPQSAQTPPDWSRQRLEMPLEGAERFEATLFAARGERLAAFDTRTRRLLIWRGDVLERSSELPAQLVTGVLMSSPFAWIGLEALALGRSGEAGTCLLTLERNGIGQRSSAGRGSACPLEFAGRVDWDAHGLFVCERPDADAYARGIERGAGERWFEGIERVLPAPAGQVLVVEGYCCLQHGRPLSLVDVASGASRALVLPDGDMPLGLFRQQLLVLQADELALVDATGQRRTLTRVPGGWCWPNYRLAFEPEAGALLALDPRTLELQRCVLPR